MLAGTHAWDHRYTAVVLGNGEGGGFKNTRNKKLNHYNKYHVCTLLMLVLAKACASSLMAQTGDLAPPAVCIQPPIVVNGGLIYIFFCRFSETWTIICGLIRSLWIKCMIIYHFCFRCLCTRLWRSFLSWEQNCRGGWRSCRKRPSPTPCPPLNTPPPPHTPQELHCTVLSDTQTLTLSLSATYTVKFYTNTK